MKNFVLTLITFVMLGTTVCYGKTNMEKQNPTERQRTERLERHHDRPNDKRHDVMPESKKRMKHDGAGRKGRLKTWRGTSMSSMPIKKHEVTVSVQSFRF